MQPAVLVIEKCVFPQPVEIHTFFIDKGPMGKGAPTRHQPVFSCARYAFTGDVMPAPVVFVAELICHTTPVRLAAREKTVGAILPTFPQACTTNDEKINYVSQAINND